MFPPPPPSGEQTPGAQTLHLAHNSPAQDALRDSEARYRRLFEAAKDGILILDAKTGLITDVNPFLAKLLDYSRADFRGKTLWDIGLFKDIDACKVAFRELQAKRYIRYHDLPLETRGGRSINVEFVSNVYGVNGKKVIHCNIRDITERRKAERSEQKLRQSQKMEAIGQLAGGMAHDFNNLLGVILGYCGILEDDAGLSAPNLKMIMEIHKAGASAATFTQGLLAFSRRQIAESVFLDLNEVIGRIDSMLSRLVGDEVELVSSLAPDLGTIKANPGQVEQVLMNLTINARDAMPQGGRIIIETANVDVDEERAQSLPYIKPGAYVLLTVTDNGTGMDKETQAHIFEPFFSTKPTGKGTGLGLSTVLGIVNQSGGTIAIQSAPGTGTTFCLHFPRYQDPPFAKEQLNTTVLRGGTETILLVDNAAALRLLTRRLLEDCGYAVLDSGSSEEAFDIAARHSGPLPLIVTDVVMPGSSGHALAKRITETRPETRVLYTSGNADAEGIHEPGLGLEFAYIEKPFSRDDLIRKVRELLDAPRVTFISRAGEPQQREQNYR